MYVITAHQRHRQTDRQTDVKRSHDRYIAKACSGKNVREHSCNFFFNFACIQYAAYIAHYIYACRLRVLFIFHILLYFAITGLKGANLWQGVSLSDWRQTGSE